MYWKSNPNATKARAMNAKAKHFILYHRYSRLDRESVFFCQAAASSTIIRISTKFRASTCSVDGMGWGFLLASRSFYQKNANTAFPLNDS
jgi:hypothetical protein